MKGGGFRNKGVGMMGGNRIQRWEIFKGISRGKRDYIMGKGGGMGGIS